MDIQLTVKELLQPLKTVIGIVEKKQTLPILAHVLIQLKNNQLSLTTSDMEIEIKSSTKIKNKKNISFVIYAKNLIDIIINLKENTIINFTVEKSITYITINNNSFKLNTLNHEDFPTLPKSKNNDIIIKIKPSILNNLIENTSFSMANQDARAYLNGLYLEINKKYIIVVATDGHRLAKGKIKHNNPTIKNKITVILPRKTIFELNKLLTKNKNYVSIQITNNYFYLSDKTTTIISRLIDGNFPNYSKVIPTNFDNNITIDKQEFLYNLEQASIFVNNHNSAKLTFKDSQLTIHTNSDRGMAKTQIKIQNFNKEIDITFNIQYLLAVLKKITTNNINMIVSYDKQTSCIIKGIDDNVYQYVIMPMQN